LGHLFAFEAVVYGKSKYKWKTFSQAAFDLREESRHAVIANRAMLPRLGITGLPRFIGKLVNHVWPQRLRPNALFADAFNSVADLRSSIALDRALHRPFVVINEQSRWSEYRL